MNKINGTAHPTAAKFYASRAKYLHISAKIMRNPKAALAEALGQMFPGPQMVVARGTTFNKGLNRAKRERRERAARLYGAGK